MIHILTGMHRSGTSMFSRFMHESGINMGSEFYRDETANKYGHYEDVDFLNLQRKELARAFNGEDYLVYKNFKLSDDFIEKSKKLFNTKTKLNKDADWGWKDPRTTVFVEHWLNIDPDIRFIFLVRKPESVINSLCRLLKTKRSIVEKTKYLNTYIYYNQRILDFIKNQSGKNWVLLSFEDLIANPSSEISKINKQFGLVLDAGLFSKYFDKKVISGSQQIPYLLLQPKLQKARLIHKTLSQYF